MPRPFLDEARRGTLANEPQVTLTSDVSVTWFGGDGRPGYLFSILPMFSSSMLIEPSGALSNRMKSGFSPSSAG